MNAPSDDFRLPDEPRPEALGPHELARNLGVGASTVYRWLDQRRRDPVGGIPAHKHGARWCFYLDEVTRWMTAQLGRPNATEG